MKNIPTLISKVLIVLTMVVSIIFAYFSLGFDEPFKSGLDRGEVGYLTENWTCTTDTGATFETILPQSLVLPEGTKQLTFTNTLPDDVKDGDVLQYHTLLGWYRIYINGELRATYGNDVETEKSILENASAAILLELTSEDAGAPIKVETGYWVLNYLATQPAPSLSNHRDLLMQDILGNSTNMALTTILTVLAFLQLAFWFVFKIKKQQSKFLLSGVIFMFCSIVYYNVANTLRAELWGYPPSQSMYGDFCYYVMEFLIPVVGYHLLSSATDWQFSKKLNFFILGHSIFAALVIAAQMLWIANLDIMERFGVILTLVGYIWIWRELKPLSRPLVEKLVLLPTYGCILGFLLDYYKLANTWWIIPESWVTFLQLTLPFMFFFPLGLMVLSPLLLWSPIESLVHEKYILKRQEEEAQLQVQLAEREYNSSIESITQIRKIRHDINHHLRAIHAFAEQAENQEICGYIEDLTRDIPVKIIGSQNFITDSFVEFYREKCYSANIKFLDNICYDENKFGNKKPLGILLGNALKNAYEATSNSEIKNPYIKINARTQGSQIVFVIENNYVGELNSDYQSTKGSQRGFGLDSIRTVTAFGGGFLSISHDNNVFKLKAVLTILD